MTDLKLRPAADGDLTALVDIYNYYIENTAVTFHKQSFTAPERIAWFTSFPKRGRTAC